MQRPTWATTIGVLMLLFGGCGITQDLKQINSKALTEFSNDLADEISKEIGDEELGAEETALLKKLTKLEQSEESNDQAETAMNADDLAEVIKTISHMPPDVVAKMKLHGSIGLGMSLLYMLGGLPIILKRKNILKIVTTILCLSLLFVIYQAIDTRDLDVSAIMKIGLDFNLYSGAALDVVLLGILFFADKTFFKELGQLEDHYD